MLSIEALIGSLFFLAVAMGIGVRLSRNRVSTVVLQKFTLSTSPLPQPHPTVELVGRMQGIVAFVLSLMGFSPITRFTIAGTELRCESSSLFGQRSQFIPLRSVSSLAAGVQKPISAIVWAVFITVLGVYVSLVFRSWAPIAIALISVIALVILYVLTKKFFIEVHSHGGPPIALLFKPNVIEGVPINVEEALAVVAVIRDMVLQQGTPASTSGPPPLPVQQRLHEPELPPFAAQHQQSEEGKVGEDLASEFLAEARRQAQSGQRQQAISILQQIIQRFPASPAADQARHSLQKIGISV
jgi:hypothetical protein